jgi:F0F1-type ATP synthase membrane subunit b/b'
LRRVLLAGCLASTLMLAQEKEHTVGVPNQTTAREVEESRVNEGNELVWKWVNFAILFGGLGYIAVKFGGPFFRNRSAEIVRGIQEAAAVKAEAEARVAAVEAKINNLEADIDELKRTSHSEMQAEAEHIRAETAAGIQKIQARAEQEIASAAKLATQELKAYTADLALKLAEQQIRNQIGPETQERLVNSFVRDLDGRSHEQGSGAAVS